MSVQSTGLEDPLEEGMGTHSSIPAWRIPMDRGAWWATVHRVTKIWTQLKPLSTHTHTHGVFDRHFLQKTLDITVRFLK